MNISIPAPRDFNFKRTVLSHGWYDLPPCALDRDTWTLACVLDTGSGAPVTVKITAAPRALNVNIARRLAPRRRRPEDRAPLRPLPGVAWSPPLWCDMTKDWLEEQ